MSIAQFDARSAVCVFENGQGARGLRRNARDQTGRLPDEGHPLNEAFEGRITDPVMRPRHSCAQSERHGGERCEIVEARTQFAARIGTAHGRVRQPEAGQIGLGCRSACGNFALGSPHRA